MSDLDTIPVGNELMTLAQLFVRMVNTLQVWCLFSYTTSRSDSEILNHEVMKNLILAFKNRYRDYYLRLILETRPHIENTFNNYFCHEFKIGGYCNEAKEFRRYFRLGFKAPKLEWVSINYEWELQQIGINVLNIDMIVINGIPIKWYQGKKFEMLGFKTENFTIISDETISNKYKYYYKNGMYLKQNRKAKKNR